MLIIVHSYLHPRRGALRERLRRIPRRQYECILRHRCSHICCKSGCSGEGRDQSVRLSAVHCKPTSHHLAPFPLKGEHESSSRVYDDSPTHPQQTCQKQAGLNTLCGSLANRTCVCQNYNLVRATGLCEAANCSVADNSSKSHTPSSFLPLGSQISPASTSTG